MFTVKEQKAIAYAVSILEKKIKTGIIISSPESVKQYLFLKLNSLEREQFDVLFLNTQNELIDHSPMFYGTIDQSPVFPREIIRKALTLNAAAIILAHNHPTGVSHPSEADKRITTIIGEACGIMDIRLLDHIIVGSSCYSFAEHGLL